MSAQFKIAVAIAMMAGGAWWFWNQPDGARASRSGSRLSTPPAAAARQTAPLAEPEMEAPTTAEELEAQLRAEKGARARVEAEEKKELEPSLSLIEAYVPAPPDPAAAGRTPSHRRHDRR